VSESSFVADFNEAWLHQSLDHFGVRRLAAAFATLDDARSLYARLASPTAISDEQSLHAKQASPWKSGGKPPHSILSVPTGDLQHLRDRDCLSVEREEHLAD
jgi:hypothetical protein